MESGEPEDEKHEIWESAVTSPTQHGAEVPVGLTQNHNPLSLRDVNPVSITLDNLSVTYNEDPGPLHTLLPGRKTGSGSQTKTILDSISAQMQPGSLTAILGSSGSGKTSLLNVMSGRMRGSRVSITGRTLFNGSEDIASVRSAYVIQQDILLPTLTVRETLTYAAQLRLPPSFGQQERQRLIEEVILELGLKEAADTRIGNNEHRGCSGGEKRRTSIGVQAGFKTMVFGLTNILV